MKFQAPIVQPVFDIIPHPAMAGNEKGLMMHGPNMDGQICHKIYVCPLIYACLKDPDTFRTTIENLKVIPLKMALTDLLNEERVYYKTLQDLPFDILLNIVTIEAKSKNLKGQSISGEINLV